MTRFRIGAAGWAIPRDVAAEFPAEGTSLQRYAARFDAAEINSSFHRPHRPSTYERWAESVPDDFRFSVKLPKTITHERRLVDCGDLLAVFLEEIAGLGEKRGPLLVQLPPSLAFDPAIAAAFFSQLQGIAVCEPRHASWFEADADSLLGDHGIARAAADPSRDERGALPGGSGHIAYFRLHGSPRIYRSSYDEAALRLWADRAAGAGAADVWIIFDNTASGAAAADALAMADILNRKAVAS